MTENTDSYEQNRTKFIQNALIDGKKQNIYIDESGIIRSVGTDIGKEFRSEAECIIDASGMVAIPGLVNTHTHAAMSLLRGYADDMHLQEWLSEKIWPLEAHLTGEDVYWGTKLASLEMIRSGTTSFNDMYFFMKDAARAVDESGIRATFCHGFIDFDSPEKRENEIAATKDLVSHIKSLQNPRLKAAVGPHAPYTVSREGLEWCAEFSETEDIMLHIHLSETEGEVEGCIEKHGMRPAAFLDSCGCLSEHTLAAHCCWLDDDECRLLGSRNVSVSHNPSSNMKLAVKRALPYQALKDAGVNITLGTDGCSSNNNLDMFEEMKFAALLQKFFWNSDTLLPADEAFSMATSNGAKALGVSTGTIQEGLPADIVLIDTATPSMVPMHNCVSNIVYSCSGGAVDTVICDGRILMSDKTIPGEAEILGKAQEIASQLVERANNPQ
ncbi:amidohydrolase [Methanogenium organophilum]|uniref:5'-deoxyadenosine deaminase n=1 Tax=Methanogenium organophilum TaxID=2199 RepID=A0A9X9S3G3_METOG|nr:amidohydrolase [Methanogenium organophilum]WAI01229.1 amidohydrolase [Methanogenium organophilum]